MKRDERRTSGGGAGDLTWCYEILRLSPGVDSREIQKAFRNLAMVWHPDRFPRSDGRLRKQAEDHFKQLNAAYQALMAESGARHDSSASAPARSARSQTRDDSAPRKAAVARTVPVMVGLIFLLALCTAVAVHGYRFWQLDLAQRNVRSRLEMSEEKKKALLTLAKTRQPAPSDLPPSVETGPVSKRSSTGTPGSQAPKTPPEASSEKGRRFGSSSDTTGTQKKRKAIRALMVRAEALTQKGRYKEAQNSYRSALSQIAAVAHRDASFDDIERQINRALESDEIRLGANGYHFYEGQWFSPEIYRTEFVQHGQDRVHYTALRPSAERFADPLVRAHLRAVFSNRLIHKNKVTCTALHLLDNGPSASRFQTRYHWEVWTFEGVEDGELTVDLVYYPREDHWEAVWLSKGS